MPEFTKVTDAYKAYVNGTASLDDLSRAASRTIADHLKRTGTVWDGFSHAEEGSLPRRGD